MHTRFNIFLCTAALALTGCSKPVPVVTEVSDAEVTEHVKTALQQNDLVKAFNITVVTTQGDVRLTAVLDSQAQVDEARRVARDAAGAHTVHDELTVKK